MNLHALKAEIRSQSFQAYAIRGPVVTLDSVLAILDRHVETSPQLGITFRVDASEAIEKLAEMLKQLEQKG